MKKEPTNEKIKGKPRRDWNPQVAIKFSAVAPLQDATYLLREGAAIWGRFSLPIIGKKSTHSVHQHPI